MSSKFWRGLVAVVCLQALAAGPTMAAQLMAGAARVSVTPDPSTTPFSLGGYVTPDRLKNHAKGVHDTVYARALVLSDGHSRVAIVSVELCFLPRNLCEEVFRRVAPLGFEAGNVFLAATHTHSSVEPLCMHSGMAGFTGRLPKYESALTEWMAGRIAQSISEAAGKLQPARVGGGQMPAPGMNRNRRGDKLTDSELSAVRVDNDSGRPIAALFCYAAHPTYFGGEMLEVSGDWSGAFQRQMEAVMPGAVVLFVNGAEGDASPAGSDEGTPAEKIMTYSARMMDLARRLHGTIRTSSNVPLSAHETQVDLPASRGNPLFLVGSVLFGGTPDIAARLVTRMMPRQCWVTTVQIGGVLLVGVPGEPTAAVGLAAKKMIRATGVRNPVIVALTNGWLGYILTADQYRAGKYEASMSFYGEEIADKILGGVAAAIKEH